jgi:hypothetical protein
LEPAHTGAFTREESFALSAVEDRRDQVPCVVEREEPDDQLAEHVLLRRAHRIVGVRARPERPLVAAEALQRVADVAVVGERVLVGAVAVGVGGERVGVALKLLLVAERVAVGIDRPRIRTGRVLVGV